MKFFEVFTLPLEVINEQNTRMYEGEKSQKDIERHVDERTNQLRGVANKLRITLRGLQAHSKNVEKSCGLSGAKLGMLREIDGNPGIKVSQLATALSIHPSIHSPAAISWINWKRIN